MTPSENELSVDSLFACSLHRGSARALRHHIHFHPLTAHAHRVASPLPYLLRPCFSLPIRLQARGTLGISSDWPFAATSTHRDGFVVRERGRVWSCDKSTH